MTISPSHWLPLVIPKRLALPITREPHPVSSIAWPIIGLAAKNAILIVEYTKVRVDNGMDVMKASIEASQIRLRPILMTSMAFILGNIPLALSTGAGSNSRSAVSYTHLPEARLCCGRGRSGGKWILRSISAE